MLGVEFRLMLLTLFFCFLFLHSFSFPGKNIQFAELLDAEELEWISHAEFAPQTRGENGNSRDLQQPHTKGFHTCRRV